MSSRDEERLKGIYLDHDSLQVDSLGKIIVGIIEPTVTLFYHELLQDQDARYFLDSDIVRERLHASLVAWLKLIFSPKSEKSFKKLVAFQKSIGNVHARINIPMHLVVEGMRIIRREIVSFLATSSIPREELVKLVILVGEILDHNLSLINESYVRNLASYERNTHALRLQLSPSAQALESERLRSSLRAWSTQLWKTLAHGDGENDLPSLGRSEFGLWIFHKIPLTLPNLTQIEDIHHHIQAIDCLLGRDINTFSQLQQLDPEKIRIIEEEIRSIDLKLDMMIEESLEQESGRDPLTKVYNRRFLDSVVKHELEVSMRHEIRFGFLLCDIDHFKKVNDTHGHDAGDAILQQFARRMLDCARVNDYVFRFGGEEFLFLYGDMTFKRLQYLAEKMRLAIVEKPFVLPSGDEIVVTASFGGAIHDGHPNFQKSLKQADEALYEAKQSGRNCWVIRT
ncbi:MAG: GGDEF domain-containing protein [Gammaproteobacteria bacterium]|nr:GGDEF domain-containing protein [Gammaproteobacteria bacterium]